MKIYTSYFAKSKALRELGIVPIAISLYPPKWFTGSNIHMLAPKKYMLDDSLSEEEYERLYVENVLEPMDIKALGSIIRNISGGRDVALLCFEKPDEFCHRHIVSKWLNKKTGVEISEYAFEEKVVVKKEVVKQPSLFDNEE